MNEAKFAAFSTPKNQKISMSQHRHATARAEMAQLNAKNHLDGAFGARIIKSD